VFSRSFSEWLMRKPRDRPGEIAFVERSVPPRIGLRELISEADVVFYIAGTSAPESASLDPRPRSRITSCPPPQFST
jgi:hypothetical protein